MLENLQMYKKLKIVKLFILVVWKLKIKPNPSASLTDAAQVVPLGCVAGLRRGVQIIQATEELTEYYL